MIMTRIYFLTTDTLLPNIVGNNTANFNLAASSFMEDSISQVDRVAYQASFCYLSILGSWVLLVFLLHVNMH